MKKENSTCEIAFAALSTLFLCCEPKYSSAAAPCVLLFLRNVTCASHAPYNMRREKRKKNNKFGKSSKIERMDYGNYYTYDLLMIFTSQL